jgi:hypothetical protein
MLGRGDALSHGPVVEELELEAARVVVDWLVEDWLVVDWVVVESVDDNSVDDDEMEVVEDATGIGGVLP